MNLFDYLDRLLAAAGIFRNLVEILARHAQTHGYEHDIRYNWLYRQGTSTPQSAEIEIGDAKVEVLFDPDSRHVGSDMHPKQDPSRSIELVVVLNQEATDDTESGSAEWVWLEKDGLIAQRMVQEPILDGEPLWDIVAEVERNSPDHLLELLSQLLHLLHQRHKGAK